MCEVSAILWEWESSWVVWSLIWKYVTWLTCWEGIVPRWRYAFIVSYSRDPDKLAIPAIRALYSQLCPIMSQYHHTILVKGWTAKIWIIAEGFHFIEIVRGLLLKKLLQFTKITLHFVVMLQWLPRIFFPVCIDFTCFLRLYIWFALYLQNWQGNDIPSCTDWICLFNRCL